MANPFTRTADASQTPNRNTFDGSFVNNLTLKMGQITPCFLKEVIPGDHFRIGATFGFNFMPMVFPVQTGMKANLHFFYVRNRALWSQWQEFITKTNSYDSITGVVNSDTLVPPYIQLTEENREMFETGKIGDYLGVPTVYYQSGAETLNLPWSWYPKGSTDTSIVYAQSVTLDFNYCPELVQSYGDVDSTVNTIVAGVLSSPTVTLPHRTSSNGGNRISLYRRIDLPFNSQNFIFNVRYQFDAYTRTAGYNMQKQFAVSADDPQTSEKWNWYGLFVVDKNTLECVSYVIFDGDDAQAVDGGLAPIARASKGFTLHSTNGNGFLEVPSTNSGPISDVSNYCVLFLSNLTSIYNSSIGRTFTRYEDSYSGYAQILSADGVLNEYRGLSELPFASSENPDGLRISALPFRAVDAVYNSFYRDERNNPLLIDGKPTYNTWILDSKGGADTHKYELYQRNWEQDVFTTAVQSPQQGVAPLVGVTATGQMTFQDEGGKTYYLQAEIGDDGTTVTGIKSYSSDMPVGTLRAMVDTISTGISINDFRNVNALQRWLETNMRKGLRYKDQLEAHFGVSPTYSELDMPEFIGGMSRDVSMNKIVQTSEGANPLGTLAGNASILGDGGQPISKFCDEHGWIIGFITISPVPVYSQQLNKQLLKTNLLDYYFPEFANIGYQPILNQEIAPLQCREANGKKLSDVFGYQRAWYEYLSSLDEVHGDFRTTMRDYLINRVFGDVPELSPDFLTIRQDEANEVFAVQDGSDKIFGQIYFDVKMKRPIPAVGIPRLE